MRLLFLATSALLLTGSLTGPSNAVADFDGVPYYFSHGLLGNGTLALGLGETQQLLPYDGCAMAQLRPERENGRVNVLGIFGPDAEQGEGTTVEIEMNSFVDGKGSQGPVARNLTVEGGHPKLFADAAAWGTAQLVVDGQPYPDPTGDGENVTASFFVTPHGFRDNGDGRLQPLAANALEPLPDETAADGDWEMHLQIQSPPDAAPTAAQFVFPSPGDLPDGSTSYNPAYVSQHLFPNLKFGGRATATITATARAPAGLNELTFTFRSASGANLGNATVAPALAADDGATVEFPLTEFGAYRVDVAGKMALGSYSITLDLAPPSEFVLDLWWDVVSLGVQARRDFADCLSRLGSSADIVAGVVGVPEPPQFNGVVVLLSLVGVATVALVAVKLTMDTVAESGFRKRSRK
ncbi:MAG: hypothetical protein AABX89_03440 [Candidatus Thermoplasmatota archaeon]